jgi:hypothetical protein
VILPESFIVTSLEGMFKLSQDRLRRMSPGELKMIEGKNVLAIPVAQIASISFDETTSKASATPP